ncbi:MAG: hypothetical protein ABR523_03360 [Desulfurivibrionaceae bacterium]
MDGTGIYEIWQGLLWPLLRLMFFVSLGLMVGNFIEALNWTSKVARLARPLTRAGRLSPVTGASFSVAFFSGVSANAMLAEAYNQGRLGKFELVMANLFNSLPRFFLHLPTVFFLTVTFIKGAAFYYVGLTMAAACLETFSVVIAGRLLLPEPQEKSAAKPDRKKKRITWRQALGGTWERFRKRIRKVAAFTVPVYVVFFLLNRFGMFEAGRDYLANHAPFLAWLHPETLGIVVLHISAELSAALAAAGSLLDTGNISNRDLVLALLVGNVLSSPMRAIRHQFPYYAGIFSPRLALELIFYSQTFRAMSMIIVGAGYYFLG